MVISLKKIFVSILIIFSTVFLFAETPVEFEETWGYVSMSRYKEYDDSIPLTDVCYFSAEVNCYGELISVPKRKTLKIKNKRAHLVFSCDSKSLTHFILTPEFTIRNKIIAQLVEATKDFDGLQIDLELVPERDTIYFLSFLKELRERLDDKMFSICVPARFKLLKTDVYPYAELAEVCDRIFVMAYDEHWSGGVPGPIASVSWCEKVLAYAQKSIPSEKLIMGIPFYGRTWADKTTTGAWYFSGANRIMGENDCTNLTYEDDIPTFSYTTEIKVTGYMNDTHSVMTLCNLYKNAGVNKTGFWRIGQEDPTVWDYIKIK